MAISGFFNPISAIQEKQKTEYPFIAVGGEQFRAVAVALIDTLKNVPKVNETTLKTILGRFFSYYDKFNNPQAYATPAERMKSLLSNPRKSEIVECMAYVLRQLAVDEIYAHPLQYREAFAHLKADNCQEILRGFETVLPMTALRALSQALGITIVLSIVEPGKELRKRVVYESPVTDMLKLEIQLQVQNTAYFPRVKNKTDFAYVGQLAIMPPKPNRQPVPAETTVAPQLRQILDDNNDLLQEMKRFEHMILKNVVDCMSFAELINLYIDFYPDKESYLGNTNEFFNQLIQAEHKPVSMESKGLSKEHLLARTMAGRICANQIDADQFFEAAELKIAKQSSRLQ